MNEPRQRRPARAISLAVLCCLLLASCDDRSPLSPSPATVTGTAPPAPGPAPVGASQTTWRADAAVLSRTGGDGCGWGRTPGETRTGVSWRITVTGSSILLEEDMSNWPTDHVPFSGALNGRQFTATYASPDNYMQFVCQFRGGTLTGTFSEDFSSFEAHETLTWGPAEGGTTVQRRWAGSRL